MLTLFLKKWRQRRKVMGAYGNDRTNAVSSTSLTMRAFLNFTRVQIVETVLARLYVDDNQKPELYALFEGPNEVVLEEIEPVLTQAGHFHALIKLYQQRGNDSKLVDALSRFVYRRSFKNQPLTFFLAVWYRRNGSTLKSKTHYRRCLLFLARSGTDH